jgi:trehalose 6-phosphate phosphatase
MKNLLSEEGAADLARLAHLPALYGFDFDGTLAPITARPEQARSPGNVFRLLHTLARVAPVAVISGRRRTDLDALVPPSVRYRIGNHGNEGAPGGPDPAMLQAVCRAWRAQLAMLFDGHALAPEALVEDKNLSLSLHFRLARQRDAVAEWLQSCIAQLDPAPRVIGGKLIYNLLPPGSLTKFEALVALTHAEAVTEVLFVGDDDTDELVFGQAPAHWVTVRVERQRGSRARYFVHHQSGVALLLERLVRDRTQASAVVRSG